VSVWDALDRRYRLILCDLWGVVHDGGHVFAGAAERLREWKGQGRTVILITNAPRPRETVERHLERLGLPRDCWDDIVTSGEAGIAALKALGRPVGFLGTASDRAVLDSRGVAITGDGFTDLACTGLEEDRPRVEDYRDELELWSSAGVRLHCLNPDRVVIHRGVAELCAGAIADAYEALGGEVVWYGKPFPAIYQRALQLAGNPPAAEVLAIGDGLQTDMLGAARMGFDAVFVSGGISKGEPFPSDFAERHGLGEWRPIAVVDGLA